MKNSKKLTFICDSNDLNRLNELSGHSFAPNIYYRDDSGVVYIQTCLDDEPVKALPEQIQKIKSFLK